MSYTVNEIFFTLQGEGRHTGRAAVFCRFVGCNLWNGQEASRASATCQFCDTDFTQVGPTGGRFNTAPELAAAIEANWSAAEGPRLVVFTGGEPSLQLDTALVSEVRSRGFTTAVETNGTRPLPDGLDWVCVSPKANTELVVTSGDELKLVYPQAGLDPSAFTRLDFGCFTLQPMDSPALATNTRAAADYCLSHPQWRLGLQTHKIVGLP